jgi:hypothetical protein
MSSFILGRTAPASRGYGFAERSCTAAGELITYSGDAHLMTFAPTAYGQDIRPGDLQRSDASAAPVKCLRIRLAVSWVPERQSHFIRGPCGRPMRLNVGSC